MGTTTDPIADLLTRIRNAAMAQHELLEVPASKMKERLLALLKEEGYIADYAMLPTTPQATLRVTLRYVDGRKSAIQGMKRVSTPGQRKYFGVSALPKVMSGHGIGIVSTSRGLMTDRVARRENLGGELLCAIW